MFSYLSLASGDLVVVIIVIADNKPMVLCYRCYISSFYHTFPNAYNIKIDFSVFAAISLAVAFKRRKMDYG